MYDVKEDRGSDENSCCTGVKCKGKFAVDKNGKCGIIILEKARP